MKTVYLVSILITLLVNITTIPISIFQNSIHTQQLGYGNCDALTNGEHNVIQHFIMPGDTVIDAGAHVGDWSQLVLNHTNAQCTIYAFEPVPDFFKQLTIHLQDKVHCYNYALGNKNSSALMNYCKKNGDWSSLFDRPIFCTVPVERIRINLVSLDNFCKQHKIQHIDFLKIDTEGYEWEVLQGAHEYIKNGKITTIQFEYGGTYPDAGITLRQVYHYLQSYGYSIFRIIPEGLIHIPEWRDELENSTYSNYLAVHCNYKT